MISDDNTYLVVFPVGYRSWSTGIHLGYVVIVVFNWLLFAKNISSPWNLICTRIIWHSSAIFQSVNTKLVHWIIKSLNRLWFCKRIHFQNSTLTWFLCQKHARTLLTFTLRQINHKCENSMKTIKMSIITSHDKNGERTNNLGLVWW